MPTDELFFGITGIWKPELCDPIREMMKRTAARFPVRFMVSEEAIKAHHPVIMDDFCRLPFITVAPLEAVLDESRFILSLGGDGTLLKTARQVGRREKPIIGVNFGKLGFLTEVNPEELDLLIPGLLDDRFLISDRIALEGEVFDEDGQPLENGYFWAMNDIVVDKSGYSRLITLKVKVGQEDAGTYRADGVIISTAAGSTGYSLASGGPILHPALNATVITPVCPHSLTLRPLVVPTKELITITATTQFHKILVSGDGLGHDFDRPVIHVTIRQAAEKIKLVKHPGRSYFDVLRAKLMWTTDGRLS